jgi:excisionase family DNA binding protein
MQVVDAWLAGGTVSSAEPPRFLSTREVAEYLRLTERTVYDLVRDKQIPSARVAGKWLFPRDLVDRWIDENTDTSSLASKSASTPLIAAGSHDPLLEWAARESDCGLALLSRGSEDGLKRVNERQAMLAALHLLDADTGEYNLREVDALPNHRSFVLIEWARRAQGLVLAPGNPRAITGLADAIARGARLVLRPPGSGARRLHEVLCARAGLAADAGAPIAELARGEAEVAEAVAEGRADAGIAIEAVARQHRLAFVPLHVERVDLLLRRFDYFEPAVQALLAFARGDAFARRAAALGGYDVSGHGRVIRNG